MVEIDRDAGPGSPARWVNLVLGVWLFISAFVWPHTMSEQTNAWIVGLLIVLASLWAMFSPPVRYLNTLLAIWLFFSSLAMVHVNLGTPWNNCIAAVIVFFVSLVGSHRAITAGGRQPIPAS